MCKLPQCLGNYQEDDIVLANMRGNESMIRKVLALPGDTIHISDKGQVTTPRKKFRWKNEDAFIQTRSFYVPKAGDTLDFNQLNDVEQDYAIAYLREKGEHIVVKTTLMQGDREINLDRVGATKIANRQVSLNEIDDLPWQDRFLIETQIRQSEPGNAPITLKRNIFHRPLNNENLASADSTIEPIQKIAITDDCYYIICNKGSGCPDSRETGYVTSEKIKGKFVEWPTRFNNTVFSPVVRYIGAGIRILSETSDHVANSISNLITKVQTLFNSDDTKEQTSSNKNMDKENKKRK